jgi:hypothetical protein
MVFGDNAAMHCRTKSNLIAISGLTIRTASRIPSTGITQSGRSLPLLLDTKLENRNDELEECLIAILGVNKRSFGGEFLQHIEALNSSPRKTLHRTSSTEGSDAGKHKLRPLETPMLVSTHGKCGHDEDNAVQKQPVSVFVSFRDMFRRFCRL